MGNTVVSPLAHQFNAHFHSFKSRTAPIYGVAVHQTGSGEVENALKHGADPLEYLAEYYLKPDSYCAGYVIGYDGAIIQIMQDDLAAQHIGFLPDDRAAFLDGSWEARVSPDTLRLWKALWPAFKSPAHLFPGPSPNNVYVGMELVPIVDGCGATPMAPGLIFTAAQHEACAQLAHDIAVRAQLPTGWQFGNRLLTHEDVNPLQRSSKSGGWDPGFMRDQPWFDMRWVRTHITAEFSPGVV